MAKGELRATGLVVSILSILSLVDPRLTSCYVSAVQEIGNRVAGTPLQLTGSHTRGGRRLVPTDSRSRKRLQARG